MNQKQFLAFAVLYVENKGKANSAASAALPVPVVPGSAAGGVLCAVPQALKDLRSHGTISHESLKAIKLYIVPPLSKHVCSKHVQNNKIVYEEMWRIEQDSADPRLDCAFLGGFLLAAFGWLQEGG